jgi:hypothetical protein
LTQSNIGNFYAGNRPPLLDLLWSVRSSLKASDDRDLVFALLGLTGDVNELGILPDYKKPLRKVYIELALTLIEKYAIGVLLKSEMLQTDPELPSWVPDWRRRTAEGIDCGKPFFRATGVAKNSKYSYGPGLRNLPLGRLLRGFY